MPVAEQAQQEESSQVVSVSVTALRDWKCLIITTSESGDTWIKSFGFAYLWTTVGV